MIAFHFLSLYNVQNSLQCSKHEKSPRIIAAKQISKTPSPKVERSKQKEVKLAKMPSEH